MAWSAVSSAVTTIGKLLGEETVYLWGVKEQVDRLQTELKWMRSSLMEADVKQHEDERIRLWVAEIRELAYDAEDVIEDFALRVGSKRKGGLSGCLKRSACILIEGWELHATRSKIEKIIGRILDLVRRLQVYDIKGLKDGEGSSSLSVRRELRRPYPHVIDQNVVGLNHVIKKLVPILVEEGTHTHCRVVSISGMGGLGKTTLAKKLYHDSQVTSHFKHLALVFVSQQFQTRKVWEDILSGFKKPDGDDRKQNDEQLASKLFNLLKHEKCLVILDDIWSNDAWDRLRPAFPVARDIRSNSKILLTTRNKEMVSHADRSGYLYELPFLNEEESWELFQNIAFPPSDSTVSSKEEGDEEWEVAEDVAEHYVMELAARCIIQVRDRDPATLKVKTLQLHDEMRFLCLSKAKQENFLFIVDESNASSSSTMRKIRRISALKCFETQRIECPNLRSLSFFNTTRSLKELFEVGKPSACETGPFSRLSCFWDILLTAYISFLKARGFWVYIFTNLKLLRVLNYEGPYEDVECKLIGDIGNLIHLRFLGLRRLKFKGSKLPPSLGKLRFLQTLDLRVDAYYNIQVPDVIWRMEQLRHLYLPPPFKCTRKTKLKLGTLRNLLTLVNFNTKNCYLKDLIDMTNLRVLDVCGPFKIQGFNEKKLDENPPIMQAKYLHTLSIRSLGQEIDPRHLNHLLSNCSSICKLSLVHIKISKLPELRYLSSNLAYIHLENCELQEDPMPTLEQLPNLRVLELHSDAFQGKKMFCSAQGFPKLESLSLEYLFNLEQWKVYEGAMPCLGRLEITRCSRLDMGPVRQRFNKILKEGID
ncbi:hypothetical protein V6N13_009786 [Hibiscus sabdariffa]